MERRAEASALNFSDLFLIVSDISLFSGLGTTALRLKDNVETWTGRVDGQVPSDSSTVRADLRRFVVCTVEHLYIVKRTATHRHRQTYRQTDRQMGTHRLPVTEGAYI